MRITDVTATQLRIPNIKNVFDGTQDILVIQVTTDTGMVGLGEVVSASTIAKAIVEAPRSAAGRHGLAQAILGLDPADIPGVWRAMYEASQWYGRRGVAIHAMGGIELALWDLNARAQGVPVYRLLQQEFGAAAAGGLVKAYASVLWSDTMEGTMAEARRLIELGFGALKFGFGAFGLGTVDDDLRTLERLRRELGDGVDLMVDIGRKWDVVRALAECRALEDKGLVWLEEPLHPDDLDGYRKLCAGTTVPIAGAETEETVPQFEAFLEAGLAVVQPDLGRCGLRAGLAVSRLTRSRSRRCVPHCFGSGINTTAAIHWMTATGGDLTEYPMGDSPLRRELVVGVPQLQAGSVSPSERPGFGIELDPGIMERFRV